MAFRIKRGMVLRTTKSMKVGKRTLPANSRVKAMSKVDANTLRVKIKDTDQPDSMQGVHVELSFDNVVRVARGRPTVESEDEE